MRQHAAFDLNPAYRPMAGFKGPLRRATLALDPGHRLTRPLRYPLVYQQRHKRGKPVHEPGYGIRIPGARSNPHKPLNQPFRHKADHPQRQHQEQYKGTHLPGI